MCAHKVAQAALFFLFLARGSSALPSPRTRARRPPYIHAYIHTNLSRVYEPVVEGKGVRGVICKGGRIREGGCKEEHGVCLHVRFDMLYKFVLQCMGLCFLPSIITDSVWKPCTYVINTKTRLLLLAFNPIHVISSHQPGTCPNQPTTKYSLFLVHDAPLPPPFPLYFLLLLLQLFPPLQVCVESDRCTGGRGRGEAKKTSVAAFYLEHKYRVPLVSS
ncbi:hypothetical protein B0I35DRAFT_422673 [Stachybotrys elegans]|uniref:Secreted protein n=1 Tax=Stachybotrys elegans TaxID=80388 RepID=A0A8K0SZQ1_9HYPO|nr:hypothetical protein B0I35DRAFT_422673 [Stachybotrys elegans]